MGGGGHSTNGVQTLVGPIVDIPVAGRVGLLTVEGRDAPRQGPGPAAADPPVLRVVLRTLAAVAR